MSEVDIATTSLTRAQLVRKKGRVRRKKETVVVDMIFGLKRLRRKAGRMIRYISISSPRQFKVISRGSSNFSSLNRPPFYPLKRGVCQHLVPQLLALGRG